MKTVLQSLHSFVLTLVLFVVAVPVTAQNSAKSLLLNHGSTACGNQTAEQQFFSGAVSATPTQVQTGNVGLPYGGVFAAYNPADHKMYYADINGTTTKVYVMDYNFGGALTAPTASSPNYTYNYILNQLCFDNKGNNYGFKSFNPADGKAKLVKVDITNGNEIGGTARSLQFPAGRIPNTVGDGDIVVLPNGRLFATFGNAPSMLYELSDPNNSGNMTVTYLASMPRTCFSIAFVDGNLMIAGSDGGGCYYYTWDINSFALSPATAFPGSKSSADMTNITAAIGSSKELLLAQSINSNTARLTYQIVVKNKGSITLNNVQAMDDLAAVFGAANVSNVRTLFVSNPAGLQLNPNYNGTTDLNLLLPGQRLENYPATVDSFVLTVTATVTNLSARRLYKNSAIATGSFGSGASAVNVSDSSNNGRVMDPDGNGVSDDAGENIPTPYAFAGALPVSGVKLSAAKTANGVNLQWDDAANPATAVYSVERSTDGRRFETLAVVNLQNAAQTVYRDETALTTAVVYYRVKATYPGGGWEYSNTAALRNQSALNANVYPNPFNTVLRIELTATSNEPAQVQVQDAGGRVMKTETVRLLKGANALQLDGTQWTPGLYFVTIKNSNGTAQLQVLKQ